MKIILILIVVLGFAIIGLLIYLNYNSKKNIYKNLIEFCDYSLLEIKFNKSNFKKIIENYLNNCNLEVKNFLSSYLNRSKYSSKVIKNEDNAIIQNFLASIGRKDVDGEVYNLNKYKAIFISAFEKAREDEKKMGVASLKVSIVLGLLIAIILI